LTGLRGLAALYVAIYHMFSPWLRSQPISPFHISTFLQHGYMSVDMFFILSGFVITLSSKKLFETGINRSAYILFMKRRFSRIYPIYIIVTLIAFGFISKFHGIGVLMTNALLIQILTGGECILRPSWTLSAEWLAYLLFPFFLRLAYRSKGIIWSVLCLIASFLVLLFIALHFNRFLNGAQEAKYTFGPLDKYLSVAALLRCFSEYLVGITLFKLYSSYKDQYGKCFKLGALPCTLLLIVLLSVPNSDFFLVILFAGLTFSLSTDEGVIAKTLGSKSLYFLGEISYSLYLIHPLVIDVQERIYGHLLKLNVLYSAIISYVIGGIGLIAVSYLTYTYIEIPSRNYLKRKLHC
jgi:peptidoglycan/LPS O-acetylase OafA/YrhL